MGSSVQERQKTTGENPLEGYEDDEGPGATPLYEKTERSGAVQPREGKAGRGSY